MIYFQFHWLFPLSSLFYWLAHQVIFLFHILHFSTLSSHLVLFVISISLLKCPIFFHIFLLLHMLSNFELYLRHYYYHVVDTLNSLIVLWRVSLSVCLFMCLFNKKLICLFPNCTFCLTCSGQQLNYLFISFILT